MENQLMKIKMTLDRFEENFGVCFDQNDQQFDIPRNVLSGVCEGDVFLISCSDGVFSNPEPLTEETEQRKAALTARLNRIFSRSQNKENK